MKKVSVIGIGNLGLRHLESLVNSKMNLEIYALDPNVESIENATSFLSKIDYNKETINLKFISSIKELPINIDLAIVSTNSNVRLQVVKNLINHSRVKYLILEKILFQRLKDYKECYTLIKKNNIQSYVNCPMRTYQIFVKIKSLINQSLKLKMLVNGGDWSMGCNSIHYMDLFSFLKNTNISSCKLDLDKEIIDSKRNGFIEVTGRITASYNDSTLILNSLKNDQTNKIIKIYSENNLFVLNENTGDFEHYLGNKQIANYKYKYPYQSEITKIYASDLFNYGECKLPTYSESMETHSKLIGELINFININVDSNLNYINIT